MNAPADTSALAAAAYWAPVEELVPWILNPRKHTDKDVAEMAARMRRFGFGPTIVAWQSAPRHTYPGGRVQAPGHRISIGHKRRLAARKLWAETPDFKFPDAPGVGFVPVRFVNYASEEEFEKAATSDDATRSDYDTDLLQQILERHQAGGESPEAFGFTGDRLKAILGDAAKASALLGRSALDRASGAASTATAALAARRTAAGGGEGSPGMLKLSGPEATTKVPAIVIGKRRLPMTPDVQAKLEVLIGAWCEKKGSPHGLAARIVEILDTNEAFKAELVGPQS